MSSVGEHFDLSGTSVASLHRFLDDIQASTLYHALETLRACVPDLTSAKLKAIYDAHFYEVSHIQVPGMDGSSTRDNDMKLCIRLFTVEEPVRFYMYLNAPFFRKDRSPGLVRAQAPYCKILLDAVMKMSHEPSLFYEGPAYRGIRVSGNHALTQQFDHYKEAYVVGQFLTFPAFTSVSLDESVADEFGDRLFFVFTSVRGVKIKILSALPHESEVLVPPPSVYKIMAVSKFHGVLVITLQEDHSSPLTYHSGFELKPPPKPAAPFALTHGNLSSVSAEELGCAVETISPAFSVYSKNFTENGFDGSTLESLDVSELNEMLSAIGITNIAHKASIKANLLKWKSCGCIPVSTSSGKIPPPKMATMTGASATQHHHSISDAPAKHSDHLPLAAGGSPSVASLVAALATSQTPQMPPPLGSTEVRLLHNFLTRSECGHLIRLGENKFVESSVVDPELGHKAVGNSTQRSSSVAFLYQSEKDPVVLAITEKVADLCKLPLSHVEVLQLTKYEKSQRYVNHRDYFEPNFKGQNRIFTILVYLNDLDSGDGGRTIFPNYKVEVVPKMGTAVFWRNCLDDGTLLPDSLHTGEVLTCTGKSKYIVNCWVRNGTILY